MDIDLENYNIWVTCNKSENINKNIYFIENENMQFRAEIQC